MIAFKKVPTTILYYIIIIYVLIPTKTQHCDFVNKNSIKIILF